MRLTWTLAWLCFCIFCSSPAEARKSAEFAYPFSQVWSGSVRLIRVDMESKVTEKDREDGYFLFNYKHGGRSYEGSVEVVVQKSKKGRTIRVVVQIPGLPKYVEGMMISKLTRKLAREYGSPAGNKPSDRRDKRGHKGDRGIAGRDGQTSPAPSGEVERSTQPPKDTSKDSSANAPRSATPR